MPTSPDVGEFRAETISMLGESNEKINVDVDASCDTVTVVPSLWPVPVAALHRRKESEIHIVAITCDTPIVPLTDESTTPKDEPISTLEYPAARLSRCVMILPLGGETAMGTGESYENISRDVPITWVTDTVITLLPL
jgi:hypothetical protein